MHPFPPGSRKRRRKGRDNGNGNNNVDGGDGDDLLEGDSEDAVGVSIVSRGLAAQALHRTIHRHRVNQDAVREAGGIAALCEILAADEDGEHAVQTRKAAWRARKFGVKDDGKGPSADPKLLRRHVVTLY